ncbi:MAG TPA: TIGR03560 family F420-dependent LLM class oxidoreductase [Actinomycetota bacterium]|nr:TIGR03560 family F420-dependent LLM class oxidoreductase [Actinomycetota bacterium]
MRVALMIEGQEDVTWDQWVALARACEDHGIESLFRSDHYVSVAGRHERGSHDAWATLAALGAVTSRLRLGALVSPATFRHPSVLAKMVVTVDHVTGGRVELGMGAGWHTEEHVAYGFPYPPDDVRTAMLEEQIEIVHGLWTGEPFSFDGDHYRLDDVRSLPTPVQRPHPPLIVGGAAGSRSTRLAARWADEYNVVFAAPEACRTKRARVAEAWNRAGRDPAAVRFSVMTVLVLGRDREEVLDRTRRMLRRSNRDADPEAWLRDTPEAVAGTVDEAVERIRALEEAGVDRVMLQHLDHEDLDVVELLGREVVPAVR